MSVMVIQADGARRIVDVDPEQAKEAMETIEQTGRQALTEMRRLVKLIRAGEEESLAPQPSLLRLDELVDGYRRAGLPVEVRVLGEPVPLPPAVDLSAYRIIQESLTNVLKHSGATEATLEVTYGEPGAPALRHRRRHPNGRARHPADDGHGLLGMRERVAVFGGTVTVGPRHEGGFEVSVKLPYGVAP